jgi:hypothetical protein
MALGGSFGTVGGGVQAVNTQAVDTQGRKSGDLGFTRLFGRGPAQTLPIKKPKQHDWWEQDGAQARTGIAGYTPGLDQPKVDLFKQYGGYGGLIGLQGPLAPGSYKLSTILGTPTQPQAPVTPQYSKADATQSLAQQLANIANTGGSIQPPLSPANMTQSKKGGPAA